MHDKPESFDDMRSRLDEIADLVADSDTSLDDALLLFEEAVNIGMLACDMAELPGDGVSEEGQDAASVVSLTPMGDGQHARQAGADPRDTGVAVD